MNSLPRLVDWSEALPGDRVADVRMLVARRVKRKRDAEAIAAEQDGRQVWLDGPRTWAVVAVIPRWVEIWRAQQ